VSTASLPCVATIDTEPQLPPRVLAQEGGIVIEHYYHGNDHGPAHAHVIGGGRPTRIGANGHPLAGDPELTPSQRAVYVHHRSRIRRAVKKIGRWLAFNEE
jgi:hypothetical protein